MAYVALVSGRLPDLRVQDVRAPRFVIQTTRGLRVTLPLGPLPTSHAGLGPSWETLGRGGRAGFLVPVDEQPRTWQASLTVAHPGDRERSVEPLLATLRQIRESKDRLHMTYGPQERGIWRMIDMTFDVTSRAPDTNEATAATVALSMQQAIDVPLVIGPPRAPASATKDNPPPPKRKPRHPYHIVGKGETLVSISMTEYGDDLHWRAIGDANGLTSTTLRVGQRLQLPL